MKSRKIFYTLLLPFLFATCTSSAQEQKDLDVAAFETAISKPDIQLLDVRTLTEYQSGHLKSSMLADWTVKDEFKKRVAAMDKSKPVYTYCLSGVRSAAAANWLREQGFSSYNLIGGIAAWKREGKPVEAAVSVKQITLSEYQSYIPSEGVILADFTASWCPPCKKMKPVIDSLVKAQTKPFKLLQVDGAAQPALASQLKVEAFPTFIIYKNGKEVWRKSGLIEASEIISNL